MNLHDALFREQAIMSFQRVVVMVASDPNLPSHSERHDIKVHLYCYNFFLNINTLTLTKRFKIFCCVNLATMETLPEQG